MSDLRLNTSPTQTKAPTTPTTPQSPATQVQGKTSEGNTVTNVTSEARGSPTSTVSNEVFAVPFEKSEPSDYNPIAPPPCSPSSCCENK